MTHRLFTKSLMTALLAVAAFGSSAQAQSSQPGFDAARLTRENFYQVLEPVARREGKLVFYNFAGNFDPVWKNGLIPRFEAHYGIKVEYHNVRKDQANQQLIAVRKAGRPSPVDVYFAGGPDNFASMASVVAPYRLDRSCRGLLLTLTRGSHLGFQLGDDSIRRNPVTRCFGARD